MLLPLIQIVFEVSTDKPFLFLDYCHHDDQAMRGRQIGIKEDRIEVVSSEEDVVDAYIDQQYRKF
ncbi:MAG: hypothetical protein ACLRQX_08435 [Turicibacter sanguinis]